MQVLLRQDYWWRYTPTGASVGTKQGFSIIKYTGPGSAGALQCYSSWIDKKPNFAFSKIEIDLGNTLEIGVYITRCGGCNNQILYLNNNLATSNFR